ncbi:MAG: response regulator [Spirochaetia bacterium]
MGKKLLIVDDSFLVRSGLQAALKKTGNWEDVILAENGRIGIDKIVSDKPDVVLMDVEMPEVDGLTALKEINAKKRAGEIPNTLPIVILSGTMYENNENVRKAKMLGAAEVIAKPEGKSSTLSIKVDELEEQVLKLL